MASAADTPDGGGQARLLASGSLVQQLAQVTGLLALFAIVTVLARRLTLEEFGVYGLLTLAGGLPPGDPELRGQRGGAGHGGGHRGCPARTQAFSTARCSSRPRGLVSGLPDRGRRLRPRVGDRPVRQSSRRGAARRRCCWGWSPPVGWPITIYRDALRASQLFVRAALIDMGALVVFAALVLALRVRRRGAGGADRGGGHHPDVRRGSAPPWRRAGGGCRSASGAGPSTREEAARLRCGWPATSRWRRPPGTIIYALDRIILGVFTVGRHGRPLRGADARAQRDPRAERARCR